MDVLDPETTNDKWKYTYITNGLWGCGIAQLWIQIMKKQNYSLEGSSSQHLVLSALRDIILVEDSLTQCEKLSN